MTGSRLASLIWPRFCSRHDRRVTRWHYRRCKHLVFVSDGTTRGDSPNA